MPRPKADLCFLRCRPNAVGTVRFGTLPPVCERCAELVREIAAGDQTRRRRDDPRRRTPVRAA
jgi:hypothetical protein